MELRAIRDKRLYKVKRPEAVAGRYSFETWEEYVEVRLDWDVSRAKQLVAAAETVEKMATNVAVLPARESHVRPLLRLDDEHERASVWQSVYRNTYPFTCTGTPV